MSAYTKSIGREKAIALAKTEWWVGLPAKEVAKTGLLITELCLPFSVLHKALEDVLGRPVFTHELGYNFDGIVQELLGERDAPTLEEILSLIPEAKRIVITP